ncbi:Phospholipase ABHD3 [Eumeta japonica]|uniref:Phospholipase ABHD3 n=1 Tax=Eumeta variegata TaxID=151549 RepID=A0A4C1SH13_EUMVA|nr:Phospholipase ABHD3 [Eumeta japonica]
MSKFKASSSAGMVVTSVLWDAEGITMADYSKKGATITGYYYADQIRRLQEVIKEKTGCKTIKEFDALFTSKQFGYAHVDDYYSDATLHNKLHYITVPLLCLSAADDPFQPLEAIPIKPAEESTHVAIVVTARGGHIGFLQGWWPSSKEEYMGRLFVEFLQQLM